MKIAIATKARWSKISGHAGHARNWLVYDCAAGSPLPAPQRITLEKLQLLHYFEDDSPHPLHGVAAMVVASAGEGFIRHMKKWGVEVLLTGETDPQVAAAKILAAEALAAPRFDITTSLCKLHEMLSHH